MLLDSGSGINAFTQLITILVIFALVLFITLYITRWIAGFQKQQMSGSNITIIESMRLTQNQVIEIVKIGDKYLAIAVSKDNTTVLTELEESQIHTFKKDEQGRDFSSIFNQFRKSLPKKDNDEMKPSDNDEE